MTIRVVQVGEVAGVAAQIDLALRGRVDMRRVLVGQPGSTWRGIAKVAAIPARAAALIEAAVDVWRLHPDVVHVHWAPNSPVGVLAGKPWLLHLHGSDIRGTRSRLYSPLIRRAAAVVVATPDLLPLVRRPAIHIPTAIEERDLGGGEHWQVGIASAARPVKGQSIVQAALELLPDIAAWAGDAPMWRGRANVTPLPIVDHASFVSRLAETRIVIGQFGLGVIGNVELEAMSVGRPVIAWCEERWYGDDPPPVLNARSARGIADHVARLLRSPTEADQIGRAGQAWVRRNNAPVRVAGELLALYESVRRSEG